MTSTEVAETHDSPGRVAGLDGLRGIAALIVVVFHCWVQAGQPVVDHGVIHDFIGGGYAGVDLFFVISGFVLFLPMVRRRGAGSGRAYALRRFGRIAPPYYASLVIAIALNPWVRIWVPDRSAWSIAGVAHLFFLQTPVLGFSKSLGFGGVGQVWTLSSEAIFYVVLFFVAKAFVRHPVGGLLLATVATLAWRYALVHTVHDENLMKGWALQFPSYVLHFALGMTVAVICVRQPVRARERFARWAPYIGFVAMMGTLFFIGRAGWRGLNKVEGPGDHQLRTLGVATCFAVFLLCVVNGPSWIRRALDVRPLRWLGQVSYGVYLYHLFFLGFAMWARTGPLVPQVTGTNQMFYALLGWDIPAACLTAWASYVFLESPVRARMKALAARQPAPAPKKIPYVTDTLRQRRPITAPSHAQRVRQ